MNQTKEFCPNCCTPWSGITDRKNDEIHICENCGDDWCVVEFGEEETE